MSQGHKTEKAKRYLDSSDHYLSVARALDYDASSLSAIDSRIDTLISAVEELHSAVEAIYEAIGGE